jgi:hypothetical protein
MTTTLNPDKVQAAIEVITFLVAENTKLLVELEAKNNVPFNQKRASDLQRLASVEMRIVSLRGLAGELEQIIA